MRNIWPTAHGLSEFMDGDAGDGTFFDACGPDAILMSTNVVAGAPLTDDELSRMRTQMIDLGYFRVGGCTLDECYRYVAGSHLYQMNAYARYGSSLADIHTLLREYSGPPNAIVIQVIKAEMLPNNEWNVFGHFIAGLGIDSILGYYCGNGDDKSALAAANGHGKIIPMRWYTWQNLLDAQIMGAFAFSKPGATPEPSQPL